MDRLRPETRRGDTVVELALGLGFLLVAAAVLLARRAPATGYERSIYASTPGLVWGLLSVALFVAVSVAVYRNTDRAVALALGLGGLAVTVVSALPIIRGYHFLGAADSLTHLGWTKDLATGVLDPSTLFYPAYHSLSLGLGRLLGIPLNHALLLAMVALFVPFLVFVPLTVRLVTGEPRAAAFAGIASWMVMPVNNVATYMVPHTNSLALFFAPVVLLATVAYLRQAGGSTHRGVTPVGALLGVLLAAYVILHLQHAVNLLLVFGAICGVQFVYRRYRSDHPVAQHRPLYAPTAFLGFLVAGWVATHDTATRAAEITFENLLSGDVGAAAEIGQRSASLLTIGAGLTELFVKLFLVSAVFAAITGVYMLLADRNAIDVYRERRALVRYAIVALVPLTALFVVYAVGTPKMAFRQLGFIFVVVTVVSGLALAWTFDRLDSLTVVGRPAVAVFLTMCLLVSLMAVFPSPFIYRSSPGVSEQSVSGYETAFDHRDPGIPLASLATEPTRFANGIYGTTTSASMDVSGGGDGVVNASMVNRGSPAAYPADRYYLALTDADVETELVVYEQLNYDRESLQAFRSSTHSDRVLANGGYELYLVTNATGS
ncbi:hypothetical protein ACKVMT_13290 [Halobacteriales archaeon Cl-PHB]